MTRVYIGHKDRNPEGSSMYLLAQQAADLLGGTLGRNLDGITGETPVVCISPDDVQKALDLKRYQPYKSLYVLMGGNHLEYPPHQMMGWMVGLVSGALDGYIVHSQYNYDAIMAMCRQYLGGSALQTIRKKLHLVLWGVSDEFQFNLEGRQATKWVVPFNRVSHHYKNMGLHHDVCTQLQSAVAGMEQLFIFNGITGKYDESGYPAYTVVPQGDRHQYKLYIEPCSAFLCTSPSESFGIYYLELMKSGLVGVFHDKPWARLLLPDYPLMFNAQELPGACLSVVQNLPQYQAMLKEYVDRYFPIFDFKRVQADLKKVVI